MDWSSARLVLARSKELLRPDESTQVASEIVPVDKTPPHRKFVVEHVIDGTDLARKLQIRFAQMCCEPRQLVISRARLSPGPSEDTWRIQQQYMDILDLFSSHIFDSAAGQADESHWRDDPSLELRVRSTLQEDFHGQFGVALCGNVEHGHQIIIWALRNKVEACDVHQYLLDHFPEMRVGSHFKLDHLARLDRRFVSAGWAVTVYEH